MRKIWSRKKNKESQKESFYGVLGVALFACLIIVSYRATGSLLTSATVGDRELPIYCVDTTENKVALSFDAAWGAVRTRQ